MYLTRDRLGSMGGEVVVLPTLAPGTVVKSVYTTPLSSERSTIQVDIEDAQNKALNRVPWPHKFFRSFMTGPKVPVPAFYGDMQFTDPKLVQSGYFQHVGDGTDKDIALYLYNNQDAVNAHFTACVQEVIDAEKANVARKKAAEKKKGIITLIVGVVVGVVTMGIGTIAVAAVTLAQAGYSVYHAKTLSKAQLADVKALMAYLGVNDSAMDLFRTWIVRLAEAPPEVPPTPTNVVPTSRYTFFINGEYSLEENDPQAGMAQLLGWTEVGDRVTIKDDAAQTVYRVYLRVKDGFSGVPLDQAATVQSLPEDMAVSVAGGWFNPLILLLAVPAWLLVKK
jgi:hypothetical protein